MPSSGKAKASAKDVNREIGDAALKSKTGRTWSQWRKALDADGCRKMDHKTIAAHVGRKYGLEPWWRQMVTVGYERLVGLRERYEKTDGFAANVSKTIATDLGSLYKAWSDARIRRKWLGEEAVTIRTASKDKSVRLNWSDKTSRVNVNVYAKAPGKSLVTVEHGKLPNARAVTKMKALWAERLGVLKELLESRPGSRQSAASERRGAGP